MVDWLGVRKSVKREKTMAEAVNDRVCVFHIPITIISRSILMKCDNGQKRTNFDMIMNLKPIT